MQAKRGRLRPPHQTPYSLPTNKIDPDGLAINNPAMPCVAGQAGKNGITIPERMVIGNGIVFDHLQTMVGGRATWVDDAVVWGVGGPGGVWGYR